MAITLDGTNGILSPDFEPSSSTTPTNGLFLPTTNALGFATNSTERLRLDASGNLGLGVTPSAWGTGIKSFDIGAYSSLLFDGSQSTYLINNAVYNGGWKYKNTAYATYYNTSGSTGAHYWFTAPSGTAGAAISFTQAMTLDASGNLGIGTTSPTAIGSSRVVEIGATAGNSSFQLFSVAGAIKGSIYANATETSLGSVAAIPLLFKTSDTERARIDSSGNLLVGMTVASARFAVTTDTSSTSGNRVALFASTYASDNSYHCIATIKQSSTTTTANVFQAFYIGGGGALSGYITANGANAATFTSSSDARLKENITALPNQLANICALKPSEFDYKDGTGHQIGFIAQEMQEVYPDCVAEDGDGMLMISGWSKTEARLVKAIQELTAKVTALEAK